MPRKKTIIMPEGYKAIPQDMPEILGLTATEPPSPRPGAKDALLELLLGKEWVQYLVVVRGLTELLLSRMGEEAISGLIGTTTSKKDRDAAKEAEDAAYRMSPSKKYPKGQLYLPGMNFNGSLFFMSHFLKEGKKQVSTGFGPFIQVQEAYVGLGTENYEIGRVVARTLNKGKSNAIVAFRPLIEEWRCQFHVRVNSGQYKESTIKHLVEMAGFGGVGCWRPSAPTKPGPFGQYVVEVFEQDDVFRQLWADHIIKNHRKAA